jgi:hypothetical protein
MGAAVLSWATPPVFRIKKIIRVAESVLRGSELLSCNVGLGEVYVAAREALLGEALILLGNLWLRLNTLRGEYTLTTFCGSMGW